MATDIEAEVENLLQLLDLVERSIRRDASPLKNQRGVRLASRLYEVAKLVERECNSVEIEDDEPESPTEDLEGRHPVKRERPRVESDTDSETDHEISEETLEVKSEGRASTQPISHMSVNLTTSASVPTLSPPQPPLSQQSSLPDIGNRFNAKRPPLLDEHAKRHRKEAEELARKLEKRQSFSCGVSYTGDEKEKDFSDGFKGAIKVHLPALKTHKLLFHYMAWATRERLECDHCRKCKTKFK